MSYKKCMEKNEVWIPRIDKFNAMQKHFKENEPREQYYHIARELVDRNECFDKAIGISLFLAIWNIAAYKNGIFDFQKVKKYIENNLVHFEKVKEQKFEDDFDEMLTKKLFFELLGASKYYKDWKSPVGVAKALHILCPNYFPIWDDKISKGYGICYFRKNPEDKYIIYSRKIKKICDELKKKKVQENLLKRIDEFNYCVFVLKKGEGWKTYFETSPVEIR